MRDGERYLNSESGAIRLIVTVLAAALPTTPPFSVHVAGLLMHAVAPTIPA